VARGVLPLALCDGVIFAKVVTLAFKCFIVGLLDGVDVLVVVDGLFHCIFLSWFGRFSFPLSVYIISYLKEKVKGFLKNIFLFF